jgi:hypothetical protein
VQAPVRGAARSTAGSMHGSNSCTQHQGSQHPAARSCMAKPCLCSSTAPPLGTPLRDQLAIQYNGNLACSPHSKMWAFSDTYSQCNSHTAVAVGAAAAPVSGESEPPLPLLLLLQLLPTLCLVFYPCGACWRQTTLPAVQAAQGCRGCCVACCATKHDSTAVC